MNPAAAPLAFLKKVLPETGWSSLIAIDPESGAISGHAVNRESLQQVEPWLEEQTTGHRNLYWTPNEVASPLDKKPKKSDILTFRYVHLDLDDPSPEALARLKSYRLPATIILFSGGGYQAFWKLKEPVRVNGNATQLEAANKQVSADLGGDKGTWNLDRIMRLPGTTNWPDETKRARGRKAAQAKVLELDLTRTYALEVFGAESPHTDQSVELFNTVLKVVRSKPEATDEELLALFAEHPHVVRQPGPQRERTITRCIEKARERWPDANNDHPVAADYSLPEMLERFVHIARGPVIVDSLSPQRKLRLSEFHALYAHCRTGNGKVQANTSRMWAEAPRRICVDDIGFDPGQGRFYAHDGRTLFNQWTRPDWPQTDPAHATPFLDHCEFLVPDATERRDLLDWLAAIVQQPETRPHWHVLLVAPTQGMGRSWIAEVFRRLLSEQHMAELDLHALLEDNFNSQLSAKVLVAVHEVKAPPNERFQHRERLNSLLTDTRLVVNEKHLPRWSEKFVARFLMFTNRSDALPLSESDRRLYVVRCAHAPRAPDYYSKLYRLLDEKQFLAAVWHALAMRDLTNYNPGLIAPLTEAKLQMIEAGRTPEQQRAVDFLRAAPFDVIAASDLSALLTPLGDGESAKDQQHRHAAMLAVLRELGVQTYPKKLWMVGKTPTRAWILRDQDKWRNTGAALVREAAIAAGDELNKHSRLIDRCLAAWEAPEGESVERLDF
jgi:hypothetical protein